MVNRPTMAQSVPSTTTDTGKKISLVFTKAPIRDVLKLLFQSAGINYKLDSDIQGNVTVDINEVSFDTALHALLRSTNPPLTYDFSGPIFILKRKAFIGAADAPQVSQTQSPSYNLYKIPPPYDSANVKSALLNQPCGRPTPVNGTSASQYSIYGVPVNHYDPAMIAALVVDNASIVNVPPNIVIPEIGATAGRQGGSNGAGLPFIGGSTANFVTSR